MIGKLITRPIAVTMSLIAIIVLGVVSLQMIPVSLMPKIDIPLITVQIPATGYPARELDIAIIKPLRNQLMQTPNLKEIRTESKDDIGVISLEFDYGSDIDLLFIEVNEKIDRAMGYLPRDVERPKVIKASAGDIPAYYINVSLTDHTDDVNDFVNLSTFVSQVVVKRIEQIPSVAMVDISGTLYPEYYVEVDQNKVNAAGISVDDIYKAIKQADVKLGNLTIRDGEYQYNIRVESSIRTVDDIASIRLNVGERIFILSDFAEIKQQPQPRRCVVRSAGSDAVTMAVIKQSDAKMSELQQDVDNLLNHLRWENQTVKFDVTRDQTQLLSYSINNLTSNIIVAALLACLVIFIFMGDFRSPLLVTITIPVSLIVSLLFFHLIGISINIISLSGLVLGVGMMVDNSIIVIDNITQMRLRGLGFSESIVRGTREVFMPMLSSALTTCSVFIPLIFLSGITGALFFDQAMAVTIGLMSSLLVSVLIIPVYYRSIYQSRVASSKKRKYDVFGKIITSYESMLKFLFRRQYIVWIVLLLSMAGIWFMYSVIDKEKLPPLTHDDTMLYVDWNEMIPVTENDRRISELITTLGDNVTQSTVMAGTQHFMLSHTPDLSSSEALVYLKTQSDDNLKLTQQRIEEHIRERYSKAKFEFSTPGNVFDMIFAEKEPTLVARVKSSDGSLAEPDELSKLLQSINRQLPELAVEPVLYKEHIDYATNPQTIALYNIGFSDISSALKNALGQNAILTINQNTIRIPVVGGIRNNNSMDVLQYKIRNRDSVEVSLYDLLTERRSRDLKSIVSGAEGDYYPLKLNVDDKQVPSTIAKIEEVVNEDNNLDVAFTGSYFSNRDMIIELIMVMVVALFLLYFILAAQFESLIQPLIILSEVIIDIFAALCVLWAFGVSLNLMSLIGIVVMCGIIINDSILKVDTINRLRRDGYSLKRAIMTAGVRRLKPIIMTSLTTILALAPFLYRGNMGADLQFPLSLSLIGGMFVGTIVSVLFVPILYYEIYRRRAK